jgi:hypothetical protein
MNRINRITENFETDISTKKQQALQLSGTKEKHKFNCLMCKTRY